MLFKEAVCRALLREGSRDNKYITPLYQKYKRLLDMNSDIRNESEFKQSLQKILRGAGLTALSKDGNFFLGGVARMYMEGQLTKNKNPEILFAKFPPQPPRRRGEEPKKPIAVPQHQDQFYAIKLRMLNTAIEIMRNKYIDSLGKEKIDEDFDGMSVDELISSMKPEIEKFHRKHKLGRVRANSKYGYSFDIIYNQGDMRKYAQYTNPYTWCVTTSSRYYKDYTSNNFFVVAYTPNFKEVPQEVGRNYPADEYGTSLMALRLNKKTGALAGGTFRWNHGDFATQQGSAPRIQNADQAVTWRVLEKVGITDMTLRSVFEEYKKNVGKNTESDDDSANMDADVERYFKLAQIRLNNGANPEELFAPRDPGGYRTLAKIIDGGKPSKSVYVIKVPQLGNAITILDRGKIRFEHWLEGGHFYDLSHYSKDENLFETVGFLPIINDNTGIIYDLKKHQWVSYNGHEEFGRGIQTWYYGNSRDCSINNTTLMKVPYDHTHESFLLFDTAKRDFVQFGGKYIFKEVKFANENIPYFVVVTGNNRFTAQFINTEDMSVAGTITGPVSEFVFEWVKLRKAGTYREDKSNDHVRVHGYHMGPVNNRGNREVFNNDWIIDVTHNKFLTIGGKNHFYHVEAWASSESLNNGMPSRILYVIEGDAYNSTRQLGAAMSLDDGQMLKVGHSVWIPGLKPCFSAYGVFEYRTSDGNRSTVSFEKSNNGIDLTGDGDARGLKVVGNIAYIYYVNSYGDGEVKAYIGPKHKPLVVDGISSFKQATTWNGFPDFVCLISRSTEKGASCFITMLPNGEPLAFKDGMHLAFTYTVSKRFYKHPDGDRTFEYDVLWLNKLGGGDQKVIAIENWNKEIYEIYDSYDEMDNHERQFYGFERVKSASELNNESHCFSFAKIVNEIIKKDEEFSRKRPDGADESSADRRVEG